MIQSARPGAGRYGGPRPCEGFIRRNAYRTTCGFCFFPLSMHEFIDASVWSPAGPFVASCERIPNPDFEPAEVAA